MGRKFKKKAEPGADFQLRLEAELKLSEDNRVNKIANANKSRNTEISKGDSAGVQNQPTGPIIIISSSVNFKIIYDVS